MKHTLINFYTKKIHQLHHAAQRTENDATIARGLAAAAAVREGGSAPLARALTARMEHAVAEAVRTHDLALKMYGAARVGSQN